MSAHEDGPPNGTRRDVVRGAPADALLFRLSRERWLATKHLDVAMEGFELCRLFGLDERK